MKKVTNNQGFNTFRNPNHLMYKQREWNIMLTKSDYLNHLNFRWNQQNIVVSNASKAQT